MSIKRPCMKCHATGNQALFAQYDRCTECGGSGERPLMVSVPRKRVDILTFDDIKHQNDETRLPEYWLPVHPDALELLGFDDQAVIKQRAFYAAQFYADRKNYGIADIPPVDLDRPVPLEEQPRYTRLPIPTRDDYQLVARPIFCM